MAEQTGPIWFCIAFHLVVHLLGLFMLLLLPYSWRLGSASNATAVPAFKLVLWIAALSFLWGLLRWYAHKPYRRGIRMFFLIPLMLSLGTMVYASCAMRCADYGKAWLEDELAALTELIESRLDDNPHHNRMDEYFQKKLAEALQ